MTRYLKTLGLAMVAALALSAVAAGTAAAEESTEGPGEFTITSGNYPTHLTGWDLHEEGKSTALTGNLGVTCEEANYTGMPNGPSTTLDVAPNFLNCAAGASPITITMEGCDYRFHLGDGTHTEDAPTHWNAEVSLICPEEKQVTWHVYTSAAHTTSVCTLEIPAQNLEELESNLQVTDGTGNSLTVTGEIGGIENSAEGACVGGPTTKLADATLDVNMTIEATGGTNPIHIGV